MKGKCFILINDHDHDHDDHMVDGGVEHYDIG